MCTSLGRSAQEALMLANLRHKLGKFRQNFSSTCISYSSKWYKTPWLDTGYMIQCKPGQQIVVSMHGAIKYNFHQLLVFLG